jgi:hypothetical protein
MISNSYRGAGAGARPGAVLRAVAVSNPHLGESTEAGWAMGFAWGFQGPAFSQPPPKVIAPELIDVFNEGTLAGQQAAIDGLAFDPACVSLSQSVESGAEKFVDGFHKFELLTLPIDFFEGWAHGLAAIAVLAFLLIIPRGAPSADPVQAFPGLTVKVRDQLDKLGISSGSMFFGAGFDENEEGCEILLTPVFRSLAQARDATKALQRKKFAIAQWDASNASSFSVIETSAD